MAHFEQLSFVEITSKHLKHDNWSGFKILEVGSYIVNNSIRPFFLGSEYTGVDLVAGPGVNIVYKGDNLSFPSNSFDLTISCECFEHNKNWVKTFEEMHRVTKSGGIIIVSCASRGRVEHGTNRTLPKDSPGTIILSWDYYKNLSESDIKEHFNLPEMFSKTLFFYNKKSKDLYFVGKKKGEDINLDCDFNQLVTQIKSIKRKDFNLKDFLKYLYKLPLHLLIYLPEKLYQNIAVPYCKLEFRIIRILKKLLVAF